jgi:hypothetical protein
VFGFSAAGAGSSSGGSSISTVRAAPDLPEAQGYRPSIVRIAPDHLDAARAHPTLCLTGYDLEAGLERRQLGRNLVLARRGLVALTLERLLEGVELDLHLVAHQREPERRDALVGEDAEPAILRK